MVTLRSPEPGDAQVLIAGRDQVFHRWLGPGSDNPQPTACIEVAGDIVGWVDYDSEREWLQPGEVNIGYNVFAPYRGNGHATRAVQLLNHHLAVRTGTRMATLVIDADNLRSLALARRLQFELTRTDEGQHHFARPVPPLTYSDGVVVIRPPLLDDLDADLDAKDDRQIDWMWLPGERETWTAMNPRQRRDHARRRLQRRRDDFGTGPKWTFSVDAQGLSLRRVRRLRPLEPRRPGWGSQHHLLGAPELPGQGLRQSGGPVGDAVPPRTHRRPARPHHRGHRECRLTPRRCGRRRGSNRAMGERRGTHHGPPRRQIARVVVVRAR